MDHTCREAYQLSYELYRTLGNYQPSPYAPWSAEDLAWMAGADDASGCYPDRATSAPAPTPPASADQLSLF